MDLLPVSSSSVPAVTTDHQVPALSADTRPRTRAGKLVTLYLQPELFLCGVIILIFAPAIKQALTSSFRDFSFSWILFKWAQTLKRKVRRLWKGSYKSTIPITQLFPRCDMKKIFAGVRVGGVQAAPWQCAGAGRCCSGERFRDYPRRTPDTEPRLSLDCWTFICSYTLIISNLLHSAVIQQPFEYFQWGPTQWIELIMCLSFVWTSGDWCSGLWLNNISPAFLILATMQQWPVPCLCAILPILKGISFLTSNFTKHNWICV